MAAVASAPTYCWVDSAMDHGIVGGSLKSQEAADRGGRRAGAPGPSRRAGRQHPVVLARSECPSGGLASASALGHQRSARPCWNARPVSRAFGLGSLQGVHRGRDGAPAGAGGVDRGTARSASATPAGGDAAARESERAAHRQRPAARRGGKRALADRPRASRRHRPAHGGADDGARRPGPGAVRWRRPTCGIADPRRCPTRRASWRRDIQSISHVLHSSKLDYLGLVLGSAGLLPGIVEQQNIDIDFSRDDIPDDVPTDVALCVFRVLQEAVNNAVKHAGARHVTVALRDARGRDSARGRRRRDRLRSGRGDDRPRAGADQHEGEAQPRQG